MIRIPHWSRKKLRERGRKAMWAPKKKDWGPGEEGMEWGVVRKPKEKNKNSELWIL